MFEVKLCLAIDISIDIIAVALDFPVVSTISIALIPERRHLLPPGDRALEARVRVHILLGVHVLEPYFGAAPQLRTRPARCRFRGLLLLHSPQRVVVMVPIEAGDYLLARAGPVRQLRRVQEEAQSLIPQADGGGASQRQLLDALVNLDIQVSGARLLTSSSLKSVAHAVAAKTPTIINDF